MSDKQLTVETVVVGPKSKYGFKVGETWYNLDRPLTPDNFETGSTVEVRTYAGSKGGKRVAELVGPVDTLFKAVQPKGSIRNGDDSTATVVSNTQRTQYVGRDFNAEARGKVYNNLAASLAMSPYLTGAENDNDFVTRIHDIALKLAEKTFEYQRS